MKIDLIVDDEIQEESLLKVANENHLSKTDKKDSLIEDYVRI